MYDKQDMKLFRDPTLNYIEVPRNYVAQLIDTFPLQRLKDVAQTGVRPVFPCATHDRFTHSLGVYHHGSQLFASLEASLAKVLSQEVKERCDLKEDSTLLERYRSLFQLACILHDIGHPATSHTYEYLYRNTSVALDPTLVSCIDLKEFCRVQATLDKEYPDDTGKPKEVLESYLEECLSDALSVDLGTTAKKWFSARFDPIHASPHELMGAIQILCDVDLQKRIAAMIPQGLQPGDLAFMACMITGTTYRIPPGGKSALDDSLRNCIIRLLNGIIDADGIDYLSRNAHYAGHATTNLDVTRLTSAFALYYDATTDTLSPVIRKSALSVIECFQAARHFEPRWLYGHHKITYTSQFMESYLFKKVARYLFAQDEEQWETLAITQLGLTAVATGSLTTSPADAFNQVLGHCSDLVGGLNRAFRESGDGALSPLWSLLEIVESCLDSQCRTKKTMFGHFITACYYGIADYYTWLREQTVLPPTDQVPYWQDKLTELSQLLQGISTCYATLSKVKNTYPLYLLAPVATFVRGGVADVTAPRFFKSTDSDIRALFKQSNLQYPTSRTWDDLSQAERDVGNEAEYRMFQDVLREYATHSYRTSLWKSQEEYWRFVDQICRAQKNVWSRDYVNEKILEIVDTGKMEEFEDIRRYSEKRRILANAVFLSPVLNQDKKEASTPFYQVFGELGAGLVVVVYQPRYKNFGKLNILFDDDAFTGGHGQPFLPFSDFDTYRPPSQTPFPYLYYQPHTLAGDGEDAPTRNDLLNTLKERITAFILTHREEVKSVTLHDSVERGGKVIRDNVHGDIFLPQRFLDIVNTPVFQRLRRIKQLSTADHIFPGAEHTRFAHSIGTFYVMNLLLDRICTLFDYLKIEYTTDERDAVLVAALLHDIGHGPFSHAYEAIADGATSHEAWSRETIQRDTDLGRVFENSFGRDFKAKVLDMLSNGKDTNLTTENLGLRNVFRALVSSQFDADRMDYLMRDSQSTGTPLGTFDLQTLISHLQLTQYGGCMRLCLNESAIYNVEQFLIARYHMYANVYYAPYKLLSEHILRAIGKRMRTLSVSDPTSLCYQIATGTISLTSYVELDDVVFQGEMQACLARSDDPILKELIRCFYHRSGYRRLRILGESRQDNERFLREIESVLGFSLEGYASIIYPIAAFHAYTRDGEESILITRRNGTLVDIADLSPALCSMNGEAKTWYTETSYLYLNESLFALECEATHSGQSKTALDTIRHYEAQFSLRGHTEIEEKCSCTAADLIAAQQLDRLFTHPALAHYVVVEGSLKTGKQVDTYYDTSDLLLAQQNTSYRCRALSDSYVFTVKKSIDPCISQNHGQFLRSEYECTTTSPLLGIENSAKLESFEMEHLAPIFCQIDERHYTSHQLKDTVVVENQRTSYLVARSDSDFQCEVALDTVQFHHGTRTIPDHQIELELKSEQPIFQVELGQFAKAFYTALGMTNPTTEHLSKYQKALHHFGLLPDSK